MRKTKTELNPSFNHLKKFIQELPSLFDQEGEIIYEGRNILKVYEIEDTILVVKKFKKPILINQIAYTFFRKSKAERSFQHALKLVEIGNLTPEPIAYIEIKENSLLIESYYICIYEKGTEDLRKHMDGSKYDKKLLNDLAVFITNLHTNHIFHLDLSPGNILFKKTEEEAYHFTLVDINRLKFEKLSFSRRYKNFSRLCCSFTISSELAQLYAKLNHLNEEICIQKINYYSDRFFLNKAFYISFRRTRRQEGWKKAFSGPLWLQLTTIFFNPTKISSLRLRKVECIYKEYVLQYDYRKVLPRKLKLKTGSKKRII